MKERPILMSAPMVKAILDGTKTQTRREINRLAGFGKIKEFQRSNTPGYDWTFRKRGCWNDIRHDRLMACCPYGQVGQRLWVRETWRPHGAIHPWDLEVEYAADGARRLIKDGEFGEKDWNMPKAAARGFVPSIHMPRWASRITLEITGIRVERLMDINRWDALAEGVVSSTPCGGCGEKRWGNCIGCRAPWGDSPQEAFAELWESINGPGSFEANPFCWAIEFKRVEERK